MTDAVAHAQAAKFPHLDAAYFAYYAGRNSVWNADEGKNPFTAKELRAEFNKGRRQAAREEELNVDVEWD